LKMDPRLPGVHFGLGRVLLLDSNGEKAKEEARQEFLRELAIDPGNFMAEYEIGEIYHESGQTEQAHEHFLRAIQKHPEFEDGQIGLARVLISLKKPDEALPHLLAAVRVNPASEVSHFLLARVYQSLGDASHHEKEMTLFRKYHARPYSATAAQLPADSPASTITKQTLSDSQADRP